jgi:hypothetical protein
MVNPRPKDSAIIPRESFGTVERALAVGRVLVSANSEHAERHGQEEMGRCLLGRLRHPKTTPAEDLYLLRTMVWSAIRDCDTTNRCSCRGNRTHNNEADHIPAVTQLQIDLCGASQFVGRHAIRN